MSKDEFDIFLDEGNDNRQYVVPIPKGLKSENEKYESLLREELGDGKNPLIMIIDDDQNVRDALAIALDDKYIIEVCASGSEGIKKIDRRLCTVILDIKMEDKDGFETYSEIRKKIPLLPIIFHSAYQDLKNPYTVMNDYRPFGYIQKEGNLKALMDTVASAVKYYRQILANQILVNKITLLNTTLEQRVSDRTFEAVTAQQEASRANHLKSVYLSNMSHEIRTPINAILGYADLLREDMVKDRQHQYISDIDKINEASTHLLVIVNDILDLSKVEAGKMEVYIEDFMLGMVIEAVSDTIMPLIKTNNNRYEVIFPNKALEVETDITKLRQIILNVLTNACKFTMNGAITLHVFEYQKSDQPWLKIAISDTGIGLTEEQINTIFQRFAQANINTSKEYGGTGLGLAISQKMAHLLGGEITVESQINEGTTFSLHLPLKYIEI